MAFTHSFKFGNPTLNCKLLAQLQSAKVKHGVQNDGSICYATEDEERIENKFIGQLRDQLFSSWQLVFCPHAWAPRYQAYMSTHNVPFETQWIDEQPCFLIPRRYRPHTWKLDKRRHDKKSAAIGRASARRPTSAAC